MDIKQQVCSLDLAKRLKELGVKQESYFSWADWGNKGEYRIFHSSIRPAEPITRVAAAFTVAELGEMLIVEKATIDTFKTKHIDGRDWVTYIEYEDGRYHKEYADTEANARAAMLAYLLENNFVKV